MARPVSSVPGNGGLGDREQGAGIGGWRAEGKRQDGCTEYSRLRVWQPGMDLVKQIYRLTQEFPSNEMYGLTSQSRRAAVSIPTNIAEGHSRAHTKEYLNFISVAQGSLAELETQIEIAGRLGYFSTEKIAPILECCVSLGKELYALRNALLKKN